MEALILINGKQQGSNNLVHCFLTLELIKEKHHKIRIRAINGEYSILTLEKDSAVSSVFIVNVDKGQPGDYNTVAFPQVHKQYFLHDDYPLMQLRGFITPIAADILATLEREEEDVMGRHFAASSQENTAV